MVNFHPFFSSKENYETKETEEVNRRQKKGTEHIMRLRVGV